MKNHEVDYWQVDDKNTKKFEGLLEQMHPHFFYVYKMIKTAKIDPSQLVEIIHKIGIVRDMDDGYGKIIVETQKNTILRVRIIQDKILKPTKEEKEVL